MSWSTQPSFIKIGDFAISPFVCGMWRQLKGFEFHCAHELSFMKSIFLYFFFFVRCVAQFRNGRKIAVCTLCFGVWQKNNICKTRFHLDCYGAALSLGVPTTSQILMGDYQKLSFSTLTKVPFLIF